MMRSISRAVKSGVRKGMAARLSSQVRQAFQAKYVSVDTEQMELSELEDLLEKLKRKAMSTFRKEVANSGWNQVDEFQQELSILGVKLEEMKKNFLELRRNQDRGKLGGFLSKLKLQLDESEQVIKTQNFANIHDYHAALAARHQIAWNELWAFLEANKMHQTIPDDIQAVKQEIAQCLKASSEKINCHFKINSSEQQYKMDQEEEDIQANREKWVMACNGFCNEFLDFAATLSQEGLPHQQLKATLESEINSAVKRFEEHVEDKCLPRNQAQAALTLQLSAHTLRRQLQELIGAFLEPASEGMSLDLEMEVNPYSQESETHREEISNAEQRLDQLFGNELSRLICALRLPDHRAPTLTRAEYEALALRECSRSQQAVWDFLDDHYAEQGSSPAKGGGESRLEPKYRHAVEAQVKAEVRRCLDEHLARHADLEERYGTGSQPSWAPAITKATATTAVVEEEAEGKARKAGAAAVGPAQFGFYKGQEVIFMDPGADPSTPRLPAAATPRLARVEGFLPATPSSDLFVLVQMFGIQTEASGEGSIVRAAPAQLLPLPPPMSVTATQNKPVNRRPSKEGSWMARVFSTGEQVLYRASGTGKEILQAATVVGATTDGVVVLIHATGRERDTSAARLIKLHCVVEAASRPNSSEVGKCRPKETDVEVKKEDSLAPSKSNSARKSQHCEFHDGEEVMYVDATGVLQPATIAKVHNEEIPPFFSVVLTANGKEKNTTLDRLRKNTGSTAASDRATTTRYDAGKAGEDSSSVPVSDFEVHIVPPQFQNGEEVLYVDAEGGLQPARIAKVHNEEVPPFFTIVLSVSGMEKNTTLERLRKKMSLPSAATAPSPGPLHHDINPPPVAMPAEEGPAAAMTPAAGSPSSWELLDDGEGGSSPSNTDLELIHSVATSEAGSRSLSQSPRRARPGDSSSGTAEEALAALAALGSTLGEAIEAINRGGGTPERAEEGEGETEGEAAAAPPATEEGGVFCNGEAVLYRNAAGDLVPATIVQVHQERKPSYYTIMPSDTGRERQTEGVRLQKMGSSSSGDGTSKLRHTLGAGDGRRSSMDLDDCCVCFERRKSAVLLPCKHLCVCDECYLSQDIKVCPICRNSVTDALTGVFSS